MCCIRRSLARGSALICSATDLHREDCARIVFALPRGRARRRDEADDHARREREKQNDDGQLDQHRAEYASLFGRAQGEIRHASPSFAACRQSEAVMRFAVCIDEFHRKQISCKRKTSSSFAAKIPSAIIRRKREIRARKVFAHLVLRRNRYRYYTVLARSFRRERAPLSPPRFASRDHTRLVRAAHFCR